MIPAVCTANRIGSEVSTPKAANSLQQHYHVSTPV